MHADLNSRPILITAGATRNPIDSMRCITAHASGQTGVWLASECHLRQCPVTLLGSPIALLRLPQNIPSLEFDSTRDLLAKMQNWVLNNPNGIVIHSAAVGDFEMITHRNDKIPSGGNLVLELQPTPKILDLIKTWSSNIFLVSFKAADPSTTKEQLIQIAQAQAQRSQSDLVFANILGQIQNDVSLCTTTSHENFANRSQALDQLLHKVLQISQD